MRALTVVIFLMALVGASACQDTGVTSVHTSSTDNAVAIAGAPATSRHLPRLSRLRCWR